MSNIAVPAGTCNLFPAAVNNHLLYISRLPQTSFVLQEVSLPGVSAQPARVSTPGLMSHFAADHLTYEPLTVTFLVDEEFRAHRELHRWLNGVTGGEDRTEMTQRFVEEQSQYMWESTGQEFNRMVATHAGLTIVNGSKVPILRVLFYNVHVVQLGPVQFSVTAVDTLPTITSTATFEYDFYSIMDIK